MSSVGLVAFVYIDEDERLLNDKSTVAILP